MAKGTQSAEPCLYFWTVFYLQIYLKINSSYVMSSSISLKYILVVYWTLIHIQINISEVCTSAAGNSFGLYFLEDRMTYSIFEQYENNGIIIPSAEYMEVREKHFAALMLPFLG